MEALTWDVVHCKIKYWTTVADVVIGVRTTASIVKCSPIPSLEGSDSFFLSAGSKCHACARGCTRCRIGRGTLTGCLRTIGLGRRTGARGILPAGRIDVLRLTGRLPPLRRTTKGYPFAMVGFTNANSTILHS